ncbi:unnamed protein product [Linum tenue]|uniref:Tyrosinase copper-binding domain-containing protein n=1 Tax=Linum tenue TaxID=586396 RepID=A0AAV0PBZ6_9ROSI|nr:unnamed protein product [Linum tenue]
MASLPSAAKTPNPAANSSFLPRRHHYFSLSPSSSLRFRPKYSSGACRATSRREDDDGSHRRSTRRDVLLAGGLYGAAAALTQSPAAFSQPITAPDTTQCGAADLPAGAEPTNCCPPPARRFKDFDPTSVSSRTRVRPAAHLVDEAYVDKYKRAVELMKALPADDPRSFTQQANVHCANQANVHCAYCNGAYDQVGITPSVALQIHFSWIFFPFHRYYLYFFERILGKLIDDPTFALPFWNWDSPDGMQIPAIFADPASPLYDAIRAPDHLPGGSSPLAQWQSNRDVMHTQMVSGAKKRTLFFGTPLKAGDLADGNGQGTLERTPHGNLHIWVGDLTREYKEDMGNLYSAGRDPLFYCHHGNVDRMWDLWKTLGPRRTDFTDPDWLDAAFLFYDENCKLVRCKIRDSLDNEKLRTGYQSVPILWKDSKRVPKKIRNKATAKKRELTDLSKFPLVLNKAISVAVPRPRKNRSKAEKEEEEEVVVVKGIEIDRSQVIKFDVALNDDDDGAPAGPRDTEFAGSFVNVPHRQKPGASKFKTALTLGITDLLEDLGADGDDTVVVTLVPKVGEPVIGGLKIDYLAD